MLTLWDVIVRRTVVYLPWVAVAVVIVAVSLALGMALQRVVRRAGTARQADPDVLEFLGQCTKIAALTIGIVVALGTLGIDVSALVAGLGLLGFALGFALKDIISNTLAGVLILIYKPFRRGDKVSVSSFSGTCLEIDLRYTMLDGEGKKIFVPNSMMFTSAITVEPLAAAAAASAEESGKPPSPPELR